MPMLGPSAQGRTYLIVAQVCADIGLRQEPGYFQTLPYERHISLPDQASASGNEPKYLFKARFMNFQLHRFLYTKNGLEKKVKYVKKSLKPT